METDAVLASIDKEELADLSVHLGNIPSPTGFEEPMGEAVYTWLEENGFHPAKMEVAPGRNNVVAVLKGAGEGKSLLFNSHMDTKYGAPGDEWGAGEVLPRHISAWRDGDRLYGSPVFNDRGPMAAFFLAAKAIRDGGIKLKGDLYLTAVVGEIGSAPVDEFQGPRYFGKGVGARHLVHHGVVADFALVAECTSFCVTWTQCGCVYFQITTMGKGIYTPYIPRPTPRETGPNAVVKMAKIIQALEDWADDYIERESATIGGGTIRPNTTIGAIRGGIPHKISNSVGRCSLYFDVRLLPGKSPLSMKREIERVIRETGVEAEVRPYMTRRGFEAEGQEPLVDSIQRAHDKVIGKPMGTIDPPITSMWRDMNVFNEAGIPAATYGPFIREVWQEKPDPNAANREFLHADDLLAASKTYALIAMDICNQDAGPS